MIFMPQKKKLLKRGTKGTEMTTIFVLIWRYSGGSASGIVKAFSNVEDAAALSKVLFEHGDTSRIFQIVEVELL